MKKHLVTNSSYNHTSQNTINTGSEKILPNKAIYDVNKKIKRGKLAGCNLNANIQLRMLRLNYKTSKDTFSKLMQNALTI